MSNRLQANASSLETLSRPETFALDTVFNNDTAETQMYHFRFEKSRRTEISVTFQKGFTIGGKANFSIGVPQLFGEGSLGAEIQLQYQVSKAEGQTFEETVLMEATSDITVGPNSCYHAKVQLEEKTFITDFIVITRMEIPQDRAPVYINRKSDGELIFVYNVNNLRTTFTRKLVPCVRNLGENEKGDPKVIDFETKGVMKGSIACNHTIELKSDEPEDLKQRAQGRTWKEI
uniref:Uncharacterized protein n=1 Tax=Biomphalaria glabrata TaxID=6526 RepID=A0A2C9LV34_BIOGL